MTYKKLQRFFRGVCFVCDPASSQSDMNNQSTISDRHHKHRVIVNKSALIPDSNRFLIQLTFVYTLCYFLVFEFVYQVVYFPV